jgi:hypothetical protein
MPAKHFGTSEVFLKLVPFAPEYRICPQSMSNFVKVPFARLIAQKKRVDRGQKFGDGPVLPPCSKIFQPLRLGFVTPCCLAIALRQLGYRQPRHFGEEESVDFLKRAAFPAGVPDVRRSLPLYRQAEISPATG